MYRILLFLLVLFTVSCNQCNNVSEQKVDPLDSAASAKEDTSQLKDLPWITAINPKTGNTYLQHLPGGPARITPSQVIAAANKKYPKIQLQWIKTEGDTAFVSIADANYLSQSMGSAGAEAYLSEITYSLTEVEGIKAVSLQFTEGDHASPGVYTRDQFKALAAE